MINVSWGKMSRQLTIVFITVGFISISISLVLEAQRNRSKRFDEQTLTVEDYTPRSTLVVSENLVKRAKFPVIDVHSHHRPGFTSAQWTNIADEMDQLNLQVLVNLSGGRGRQLVHGLETVRTSVHPDRMVFFTTLDFGQRVEPGFGERAAAQLKRDVAAGAVGLKFFKNFGISVRDGRDQRVPVDHPELDPVFKMCAELNIPVLIHVGEPMSFYDPVDSFNERWLELTLLPNRRLPAEQYPSFEEMMAERDRLFAKHPKTRFISAHMGWHANDLGRLGSLLDRLPNVYVETGAILYELGRQPRTAREFFIRYQDRILFGKDSYRPDEFPYYWKRPMSISITTDIITHSGKCTGWIYLMQC